MTTPSSRDLFKSHAPLLPPDAVSATPAPQPRKWLRRVWMALVGVVFFGAGLVTSYAVMTPKVERAEATTRRATLIADAAVDNVTRCFDGLLKHYQEVRR